HLEKSFFKGKEKKKEFSFEFGGVNKTDEGVSVAPVVYSFDTDKIKDPLFTFLEQHGWERKKGFFRHLFSCPPPPLSRTRRGRPGAPRCAPPPWRGGPAGRFPRPSRPRR